MNCQYIIVEKITLISKLECESDGVLLAEAETFLSPKEMEEKPLKVEEDDEEDLVWLFKYK